MRGKRYTDGWLTVRWSKRDGDHLVESPSKPDGRLMYGILFRPLDMLGGRSLADELTECGYDLTTLEFAVRRKPPAGGAP